MQSERQFQMYRQQFISYNKTIDYFSDDLMQHMVSRVDKKKSEHVDEGEVEEEDGHVLIYTAVITRDYSISQVLECLRDAERLKEVFKARDMKFSLIELSQLIKQLIALQKEVAVNSSVIRDMVDTSYDQTLRITIWMCIAYMGLHVVPTFFMLSDMIRTELNIIICCSLSLMMHMVLIFIEWLDCRSRGTSNRFKKYL